MPLWTGSWKTWTPDDGVAVRITVGRPRPNVFPHTYEELTMLAPWELFSGGRYVERPEEEEVRIYRHRLYQQKAKMLRGMAELADRTGGMPAVLCCYEDVYAGQICHRRWLADWLLDELGWAVEEIPNRSGSRPPKKPATPMTELIDPLF